MVGVLNKIINFNNIIFYSFIYKILIFSEIILFISFFWIFFHNSLIPSINLGNIWPPRNIVSPQFSNLNIFLSLILINIRSLLFFIELGIWNKFNNCKILDIVNCIIFCSLLFITFQSIEFSRLNFCLIDSIFGCCFYYIIGLHWIHVIVGLTILYTYIYNIVNNIINFLFWYWHFIDIVWCYIIFFCYFL